MSTPTTQQLESYLPVYDSLPEEWEQGRQFLVEQLKQISNAVNIREIGWYLDEEVLSGKSFIPASTTTTGASPNLQYRSVLRKVINTGALVAGLNAGVAHGVTFDANFTLIDLWCAGTNSGTFTAKVISGNDVLMDATNVVITSPQIFDRSFTFIEYIQEV